MATDQNGDRPKRRHQNGDKRERRHLFRATTKTATLLTCGNNTAPPVFQSCPSKILLNVRRVAISLNFNFEFQRCKQDFFQDQDQDCRSQDDTLYLSRPTRS